MSNKEPGYVYILTNPSFREDWVKIGKSSRPVDVRSKEEALGCKLEWKEAAKATRFLTTKNFDLDSKELWKEAFDWFYHMCLKFKSTLKSIDTSLK